MPKWFEIWYLKSQSLKITALDGKKFGLTRNIISAHKFTGDNFNCSEMVVDIYM